MPPEEIIASVERGLYAVNFGGGQVDITSGKFVFSASEAYLIENGKVTRPVKGATLIGNGPDVLTRVAMVGNDLKLDAGVGTCGKEGQSVPGGRRPADPAHRRPHRRRHAGMSAAGGLLTPDSRDIAASQPLPFAQDELKQRIADLLAEAEAQGADAAEAAISVESGLSVTVRLGEVETIEHTRDKGLGITVYLDGRKGSASTTDFSAQAIKDTVRAAASIARYGAEDPCAGLPDASLLAWEFPDLDLYHPWDLATEEAIALAKRCEDAARAADTRIVTSEGATVNSHQGLRIYGNSHGFIGGYPGTRHSYSCSVIAQDGGGMQRDYWYSAARAEAGLESPESVGLRAAERTVRRLSARRLSTQQVPVIFAADIAGSLLGHFIAAIRGGSLYRKASFLLDHLGKQVFPEHVRIYEQPHLLKALGSAPFDSEGVATRSRDLVSDGILRSYVLDTYSARRLGLTTTGNAGGVHNLTIASGSLDLAGLLARMDRGLLITELMGMGINIVTGDYSRGAAGFWVEGGEMRYPVHEITVAGNLRDMFMGLVEVGTDVDMRGNVRTGSILIEDMTIAGE